MCGIAGHFAWDPAAPPVDRDALVRARDHMAPRGPDGKGLWMDAGRRIGLAHRRLSIIDPSEAGAQPMVLGAGRLVIAFNGEIYNYRQLRAGLEAAGRRFRTASDTEVLLQLYDRRGRDMVEELRGMFALAVWDAERRGLLLARDGFGIKPLYYADADGALRFASQVKALLAAGGVDTAPSAAGRAGFFVWGAVPEPWTLFEQIRCLPAGNTLWADGRGVRPPACWFDLGAELARAAEAPAPCTPEALRDAVRDTVRHHLVADVPVGAFLSAGLDSATLVAHAADLAPGALRSVTVAFDAFAGTRFDEAQAAGEVAARYNTAHRTERLASGELRDEYDRLRRAMDQPSIDGVNMYFASRAAARGGLKAALSGVGGDELFGGYDSFALIPRAVRLLSPLRPLRRARRAARRLSAPLARLLSAPKYASLLEYGTGYADAWLLRRALFMPWELPSVMDPDEAREGWGALEADHRRRLGLEGLSTPRARVCALEMTGYLRNQLLRDGDWAGMAHSLEVRTPLVDTFFFRRVAPMLCAQAPPGKLDLAVTPAAPLPDGVLRRPKTGFAVPFHEWFPGGGRNGPLRGVRGWARRIADDCYA